MYCAFIYADYLSINLSWNSCIFMFFYQNQFSLCSCLYSSLLNPLILSYSPPNYTQLALLLINEAYFPRWE